MGKRWTGLNLEHDWNERKAIQLRMLQLQEETQAIRTEYENLLNRLRELDSQQVQVSNGTETRMPASNNETTSLNDEAPRLEIKKDKDSDIFSRIEEIKRSISGQDALSNSNEQKQDTSIVREEAATLTKDEKSSQGRKKKLTASQLLREPPSRDKPIYKDYLILSHLKLKRKLRNSEIKELLSEHSLEVKNITVLLKNLMVKYTEITKAGHGVYEWKF